MKMNVDGVVRINCSQCGTSVKTMTEGVKLCQECYHEQEIDVMCEMVLE